MISYIKGELIDILENKVIIENNNMGYNILVPASLISSLPPIGKETKLYTYLYVREDAINLYGFMSKDDLHIFKLLLSVNGIGPKGALGVLSTVSPDDLRIAVLTDDVKSISKAPGIGSKTAQKLIIELKDKLNMEELLVNNKNASVSTSLSNEIRSETVQALVALGYSDSDAYKAVKSVDDGSFIEVEDLLKASLKKISSI